MSLAQTCHPTTGVATLHNSAEKIAIEYQREVDGVDGYIAIKECNYGDQYYLFFNSELYKVAVSDCLNPNDHTDQKTYYVHDNGFASENPSGLYNWQVDIDKKIWGDHPKIPTISILWKINDNEKVCIS